MPRVTTFVFNVYDWITNTTDVLSDLKKRIQMALSDISTGCVMVILNTHMSGEETLPKWIRFEPVAVEPSRKTGIWKVVSTSEIGVLLGEVRWYGAWRKYSFFPNKALDLVFEKDCLRDIAQFCEDQNEFRKKERNGSSGQ